MANKPAMISQVIVQKSLAGPVKKVFFNFDNDGDADEFFIAVAAFK